MNIVQRQIFLAKHIRRMKLFERIFIASLTATLRKPFDEVARLIEADGIVAARNYAERIIMIEDIGNVIQDIYKTVGVYIAGRNLRIIVKQAAKERKAFGFGLDEQWIAQIISYFNSFLLNKAVIPISETTRQQIFNVLSRGEAEGWSIDRMAFELRSDKLLLWRARMIARTEILKAQFYGAQLAEQESEWETVNQWISAHDARTRHSHREVDGKQVHNGQRFRVNRYRGTVLLGIDFMLGPGDPNASAENVINCRCTVAPRLARDKNGRIIAKNAGSNRISVILPGERFNPIAVRTI